MKITSGDAIQMCEKGSLSIIPGSDVKNHSMPEIISFINIVVPNSDDNIHITGVRNISNATKKAYIGDNRLVYNVSPLKKYAITGNSLKVVII